VAVKRAFGTDAAGSLTFTGDWRTSLGGRDDKRHPR